MAMMMKIVRLIVEIVVMVVIGIMTVNPKEPEDSRQTKPAPHCSAHTSMKTGFWPAQGSGFRVTPQTPNPKPQTQNR